MLKTRIFTALVVLSNVLGNFSLTWGMRQVGRMLSLSPWPYIVALLILWLISQMMLLSWADLSYVLPVTSVGYVLVALTGRFFLHEAISPGRWMGIGLIMMGVMLVSKTPPRAEPEDRAMAAGAGQ